LIRTAVRAALSEEPKPGTPGAPGNGEDRDERRRERGRENEKV